MSEWPGSGPSILALHGSTSTHHFWTQLAAELPERRILAPDLRGRGGSVSVGPPFGVRQHADDMLAVLDELDLHDVVIVGHSLGAFVAPSLAQRARDRVRAVVLLDGGIEVALPFFMRRALVRALFRHEAKALSRPIDRARLVEGRGWNPMLAAHPKARDSVRHWLEDAAVPAAGGVVAACSPDALPVDAVSCFFDADVRRAARELACPTRLLYAQWGRGDSRRPFYSPRHVDDLIARTPSLIAERVLGTNHLTLLFSPRVAEVVAAA